jgi:hypothetical protein
VKRSLAVTGAAIAIGGAALAWASQPPPCRAMSPSEALAANVEFPYIVFAPEPDPGSYEYLGGAISTVDTTTWARISTAAPHVRGSVTIGTPRALEGDRFDVQQITRMFATRRSAIRACYERELRVEPELAGRITIEMTIAPSGSVRHVHAMRDFLGAASVTACIVRVTQGFRFPVGPDEAEPYEIAFDVAPD